VAKGRYFRLSLGPPARASTVQACNIDKDKVEDVVNLFMGPEKVWVYKHDAEPSPKK
jgi:hypothetical protein